MRRRAASPAYVRRTVLSVDDHEVTITPLAEWRAAAERVSVVWEEWLAATGDGRERAHARYLEALADEEIAAARLEYHVDPTRTG